MKQKAHKMKNFNLSEYSGGGKLSPLSIPTNSRRYTNMNDQSPKICTNHSEKTDFPTITFTLIKKKLFTFR